eukprot:TRINITY_DN339_c1_g1_i1.p1 TRINITY_DN339_c1_g1~~TRINITY_DN339_c1_g1_i1.p1  ORF type:complete len:535 (+),score=279.63 TRINITY_DN339_c1_g1_i1:199-1605(+)
MEYFRIPDDKDKKKKKKDKVVKKAIVDSKRANHIGLLLSMMRMSPGQVKRCVLNCKDSKFTEDNLRAFLKLIPKSNEIELLKPFLTAPKEVRATLGDAEQFILAMMTVPRLETRIASFLFKRTYEEKYGELKEEIAAASHSVNELKTNVKFAKVLELVLNIGNTLNAGSFAGNGFGFTLDSLPKLRDTKSPTHPEYTLMNYLVQIIAKKRPKLLKFTEELSDIAEGSSEHLIMINAEAQDMKSGMLILAAELEAVAKIENKDASDELFVKKLGAFASTAKRELDALFKSVDKVNNDTKLMYQHYAADKNTDVVIEIGNFLNLFRAARMQNKEKDEIAKRRRNKKKRTVVQSKSTGTKIKKGKLKTPGALSTEGDGEDDDYEYEDEDGGGDVDDYFPGGEEGEEEEEEEEDGDWEYEDEEGGDEEEEEEEAPRKRSKKKSGRSKKSKRRQKEEAEEEEEEDEEEAEAEE